MPASVLAGILLFFILEKMLLWRHCHDPQCEIHEASGDLILMGDAIHNAMDGIVIGASFATDISLGVAVSLAVIAHEVRQEVGDFAVLLESGLGRARALAYDLVSSLSTIPTPAAAYLSFSAVEKAIPVMLSIAAASFIYIALADLVPGLHRTVSPTSLPKELIPMLVDVVTITLVRALS